MKISAAQMTRLQTCCSQMGKRVAGFENTREQRLAWATEILGRNVESFSTLTGEEARLLIDKAQGEIGHRAPLKHADKPARNSEQARRAGLDGRHDGEEFAAAPQLVSADQLQDIASRYQRLGWSAAQYEAWLSGKHSPLRGRKVIRTNAEANRVLWALKGMLEERGLWIDWRAA